MCTSSKRSRMEPSSRICCRLPSKQTLWAMSKYLNMGQGAPLTPWSRSHCHRWARHCGRNAGARKLCHPERNDTHACFMISFAFNAHDHGSRHACLSHVFLSRERLGPCWRGTQPPRYLTLAQVSSERHHIWPCGNCCVYPRIRPWT